MKVGDLVLENKTAISRDEYSPDMGEVIGVIALFSNEGKPIYITKEHFNEKMSWNESVKLGIPTAGQLRTIYENKDLIGWDWLKFEDDWYWTSSPCRVDSVCSVSLELGYVDYDYKYEENYVCVVREL